MTYLLILLALIACMAALDARYRLFVFARPAPALLALAGGTAMFLLWDVIAIDLGIFLHRESGLMTGVMLGPQLPLEEAFFLFFLCYNAMVLFTGALALGARRAAAARISTPVPAPEENS
ncbi:lycopene cyclase domain-containing protein [Paeniglutamicibacter psychrophenolicus]|uniref:lycopene cyclase domain-containing protein n=1 Tax=Paeniglutamicibacter psychrophenolicus TaxID=257454 RepID=UPI00277E1886|nr:lycopene cyclase domain-containing protein [Paeniglutamicibacter psychrophenolicus]MDQ0093203.1 lycopene cyclase domain-containing protein [Paeniglutamicibacter psychrophenolicus]